MVPDSKCHDWCRSNNHDPGRIADTVACTIAQSDANTSFERVTN